MSSAKNPTIGVIGAGAWGTALAQMLASDGRNVRLWALEPEVIEAVNGDHRNPLYLPSAHLAPQIRATGDLAELAGLDIVLAVTPAQHLGRVLTDMPHFAGDLVICCKGIEAGTGRLMADVARAAAPNAMQAVLSGPTFAHEVAGGLPTAVTLACEGGEEQWDRLSDAIARPEFRPYYSEDLTGAEIGGAVKNVLAIACGVVDGMELGQNARASLIARGYAEMLRFGLAKGAQAETLAGLCGLGDLVLTCSSTSSRNFSLGKALGQGEDPAALMSNRRTVAEGAHTAPVLREVAREIGIEMPIAEAVCALLEGKTRPDEMVDALLARPLRTEVALPEEGDA
ncbi:NAD(P)H-dependent glycerol-3-phosphate dehydrogenase [Croceicoccus naphthovorans]|uniref:Glycerol-3-phosphate dehydrogenase [NAD(P)+] n=1 Tax=Croceicoccus naphthovorans TaxID=1348774 RepID=A0A0G3XFB8_9SPHN|nr:NAD(P)H-dependent glycerol-3-phosphate dehydrogenase [Croceicoccus naphthovorans]AKM09341.1 glycerol-3-phosphate dehydrogenase [Croceicoccus naphthovorans]MBB3990253.1 glycerol-3-phosphate dehydrogenase (NAD(P)+) [Croceicoccus naphthovorans]